MSIIYGRGGINSGSPTYGFEGIASGSKIYSAIASAVKAALEDAPAQFWGYSQIDGTDIVVDSIGLIQATTGETAPFIVMAYPNVTVIGGRRQSVLSINSYEHVDYRWTLTYDDDSDLEYFDDIYSKVDEAVVNPYKQTFSPEFTAIIRKEGSYKLTLDVRLMTVTGQVLFNSKTDTFTIGKNTQDHIYYDVVSGNDANDGLDPNGFGLTSSTYTEATGYLTETGAFTAYNHTTAISYGYDRENTNWIYVSGELRRISAKIDNNTVQLDTNYKIGSDQTGLTSSDGAKQNFSGVAVNNTNILLKGGTTTTIATKFDTNNVTGIASIYNYGSTTIAELTTTTLTNELIDAGTSGSGTAPTMFYVGKVKLNGGAKANGLSCVLSSSTDTVKSTILVDRAEAINCAGATGGIGNFQGGGTKPVDFIIYGGDSVGARQLNDSYTVAIATSGSGTFTVNEAIGGTTPLIGTVRIWNGSSYDLYRYSSYTGSTFTLTGGLGLSATLTQTYSASVAVETSENKDNNVFITANTTDSHLRFIGNAMDSVCDSVLFQHHLYPSMKSDHNHYGWNYGRSGSRVGYMFNLNYDGGNISNYTAVHDNYASGCEWFSDASDANNDPTANLFKNMVYLRNKADNLVKGFFFGYCGQTMFSKGNGAWGTTMTQPMFSPNIPASGGTPADWNYALEENDMYGKGILNEINPNGGIELYNNNILQLDSAALTIGVDPVDTTNLVVDQNTFYALNDTDGLHLEVSGVQKTLTEFDAAIGGTNTERHPEWLDGANGDFSPATIPQNVITLPTLSGTVGVAFSYDASLMFIGADTITYTVATGTLPTGLTLSSSTGIISGTPTTEETQAGISITATNSSGADTTNTSTFDIAAYTLNWASDAYGTVDATDFTSGYQVDVSGTGFIKFKFATTTTQQITKGPSNHISFSSTGVQIRFRAGTTIDFTITNFDTLYLDGNSHTFEIDAATGIVWKVIIDGNTYTEDSTTLVNSGDFVRIQNIGGHSTSNYAGNFYNLELDDGTNYAKFNVDSGSTTTESASVGNGTLTFTGVAAEDWG